MGSMIRDVTEMKVYQKSFQISLDVHRQSLTFPKIEQYSLADQIRRASKSICANLAEGFAQQYVSKPQFKRFVMMAIGSSSEMKVWISYCKELGYIEEGTAKIWYEEFSSIENMLKALAKKV